MAEDYELDDLDLLVGLLDDEENVESRCHSTGQQNDSLETCKNNIERVDDGSPRNKTLTDTHCLNQSISKNKNKLNNSQVSNTKEPFHSQRLDSTFLDKVNPNSHLDPLEAELVAMEENMLALRKRIAKKKKDIKPEKKMVIKKVPSPTKEKSEVHSGDTDSDDDDDNRNPFEANLISSGKDIKRRLAHSSNSTPSEIKRLEILDRLKGKDNGMTTWSKTSNALLPAGTSKSDDSACTRDPFSGIRIMNPLVTASVMRDMMESRRMIEMSSLSQHVRGEEIDGDWVSIGVIVSKSETKKSQKGTHYCIWQMSDLKDCTKIISLFLFAAAYTNLWKTSVGSVVGILNAQLMKDRGDGKRDSLTLSINTHQKALLMGSSKDLGWCQGRTKQGTRCQKFVNKNVCEFCIFHIQREYQKTCSKRTEIQSSFSRVDPKKTLQNKIFGKDQVFYGGQLFTPGKESSLPAKKHRLANRGKDLATLSSLSSLKMKLKSEEIKEEDKKNSFILNHLSDKQISTVKDVVKENEGMGELLLAPTPGARNLLKHLTKEDESNKLAENPVKELSAKELLKLTEKEKKTQKRVIPVKSPFGCSSSSLRVPVLGRDLKPNSEVDLDVISPRGYSKDAKKLRAAMILKDQGGVKPTEKNFQRNKEKTLSESYKENIKKRVFDASSLKDGEKRESKFPRKEGGRDSLPLNKAKGKSLLGSVDLNSDKFKKILETKSKHTNLIQDVEDAEMDKYYNSLEKKEMLEDKMSSIMEVPITAVTCLKCKYTAFSASDLCREERHPLKTIKATKRFFECRNCKQRTVSLDKLPHRSCSHCNHSSWIRAPMGKARKGPQLETEVLSLRGNELGSYGSASGQIFLNL